MGLGIAQVRLLALTHRKSDIELEMSIDTKRKQQLTRKSTELAHSYYARLNDYNYQYSTSNGFCDLDYNYLMGQTEGGSYTPEFLQQIIFGTGNVPQKNDSSVILTDMKGRVVLNKQLATAVYSAEHYNYRNVSGSAEGTTFDKTACAVWNFITSNRNESAPYRALTEQLKGKIMTGACGLSDDEVIKVIKLLISVGGPRKGGTIYLNPNGEFSTSQVGQADDHFTQRNENNYNSEANIRNTVNNMLDENCATFYSDVDLEHQIYQSQFQKGTCYTVEAVATGEAPSNGYFSYSTMVQDWMWNGETFMTNLKYSDLEYIWNVINYLGPMLSAAIQNGYAGQAVVEQGGDYDSSSTWIMIPTALYIKGAQGQYIADEYGSRIQNGQKAIITVPDATNVRVQYVLWRTTDGKLHCEPYNEANASDYVGTDVSGSAAIPNELDTPFEGLILQYARSAVGGVDRNIAFTLTYHYTDSSNEQHDVTGYFVKSNGEVSRITEDQYNSLTSSNQDEIFMNAQDVNTLQNGLKSGVYQLCKVDNVKIGSYHKNTTMDYFIHRNLCVEKIDNSKREALTAWYNAEQAAISDQENYWDEEITNLSTELTSINKEMESVKNLKSNAIKDVFDWGSQ